MTRWQVDRGTVLYKKQVFQAGDLMPEEFTERDVFRNIYSRRLKQVEVPDESSSLPKVVTPVINTVIVPNIVAEKIVPNTHTGTVKSSPAKPMTGNRTK